MTSKLILAAIALVLAIAGAELILRATGFSYELYPSEIEFGAPAPTRMKSHFQVDRDLFWVSKPYFELLERARSDAPSVAFMGDSCTQAGRYQEFLADLLRKRHEGADLSYVNLGVGGWSSHQGLEQLKRDIVPIRPEIITVYFGWNDHWTGFGIEDKEVSRINRSNAYRLLRISRVAQLFSKAFVAVRGKREKWPLRVSLADFRSNLSEMVRIARHHQITPVLLTAPTAHRVGHEPKHLLRRHLKRLEDLVPLHQRYVEVVREVASDQGAVLCDMAREFEKLPADQLRSEYFYADGIHLLPIGNQYLAAALYDCFERNQLLGKLL